MDAPEATLHSRLARPRFAALAAALLLAGVALLLFVQLGGEPRGRISERRCIGVVRTMVTTGDWLVPRLGEVPRLQKPPLFYWLGAATATLLGDSGALAVRIPSACAALALVALLLAWGRSLLGGSAGLVAGAALVTLQFATSGRRGDAEMLLALLGVAALFCFDRLYATRRPALLWLFSGLLGLAILCKATAVLITIGLPIALFLWLQGELRRALDRRVLAALALALGIGLAWYAAVLALVPGANQTLWHDLVLPLGSGQAEGDSIHYRPPWWYVAILPMRAAPMSVLVPIVLVRLWRTRVYRDAPRRRFAALVFLAPFVAFSLLPQKQKHYTLAMLPGLALLCAESLGALGALGRARLARFGLAPAGAIGLVATGLLAAYFTLIQPLPAVALALGASALGGSFAWALVAGLRGRALSAGLALVPAFLLALALQRGVVQIFVEQLYAGGYRSLSQDERERLLRVSREHPTLVRVFQLSTDAGSSSDDD